MLNPVRNVERLTIYETMPRRPRRRPSLARVLAMPSLALILFVVAMASRL